MNNVHQVHHNKYKFFLLLKNIYLYSNIQVINDIQFNIHTQQIVLLIFCSRINKNDIIVTKYTHTFLSCRNIHPDWARENVIDFVDICAVTISVLIIKSTSSSISDSVSFKV